MTKRISVILTVVLLLLPVYPVSAENIYYISDVADFMRIKEDPTGQYHLTCDISFDDVHTVMFPDENNAFYGLLDGHGYKIKNLTLKTDEKRVGMFGYLCGTVRGIILENCRIVSNNPKAVIGGIAAYNFGRIESCQVTGSIQKCGSYMVGCGVCGYGSALTVNCSEDLYTGSTSGSNSSGINDFGEGWDTVSKDNIPGTSSQDDTHDNSLSVMISSLFQASSYPDTNGSSDKNRTNNETSAVYKSTVSSKYPTSSKSKNSSVSSKTADDKKNGSQSSIAAEASDDNDTASQKSDFVVKSKDEESDNHWVNTVVLIVCSAGLVALFGFAAYHEIMEKKAAAAKEKGDGEKSDNK